VDEERMIRLVANAAGIKAPLELPDDVTELDYLGRSVSVMGTPFIRDPETEGIVMIGEIGGDAEVKGAEFLKASGTKKPVVGFIAGRTAPPGRRMGHAGAVISGGNDTAEFKVAAMRAAGIRVAESPAALGEEMLKAMKG
jgi:succinyl-CoA synthetase alpha subunit